MRKESDDDAREPTREHATRAGISHHVAARPPLSPRPPRGRAKVLGAASPDRNRSSLTDPVDSGRFRCNALLQTRWRGLAADVGKDAGERRVPALEAFSVQHASAGLRSTPCEATASCYPSRCFNSCAASLRSSRLMGFRTCSKLAIPHGARTRGVCLIAIAGLSCALRTRTPLRRSALRRSGPVRRKLPRSRSRASGIRTPVPSRRTRHRAVPRSAK